MSDEHTPEGTSAPDDQAAVPEGKLRTGLILGSLAVFAAIIFGLFYLFVIAPAVPADGVGWSPGWFLFAFATGLTMIVLPCTLPLAFVIVPLSMGKGLLKGLSMALAFGIGIAITLSLYGVAAAVVGSLAIDSLGAPLESVKNWVYFIAGIFALVFALSEIGLLKFHMPSYKGAAPAFIQKRQDTLKALLLGLFLGNIGVGCPHPATPLLLIEIASSGDILYGWLMFLVHAIGRVLPLLLLAFMAILGVNGLKWLMTRKDAIERATGWAMVFVAGFILTLGLFSHDWWVNSGLHSGLETLTQESFVNDLLNTTLDTNVEHVHGLEEGEGLFGLPLWLGNWFLVSLWLVPIWWWYFRRKRQLEHGEEIGENSDLACEKRVLGIKRSFLIVISIFLALTFIHFMPSNFYLKSISGVGHDDDESAEHEDGLDIIGMDDLDEISQETADEFAQFKVYIEIKPDKLLLLTTGTTTESDPDISSTTTDSSDEILADTLSDAASSTQEAVWQIADRTTREVNTDVLLSDWTFRKSSFIKVRIENDAVADSSIQQPIHFHGQQLVVLSEDGIPNAAMAWTDTVLVAPSESTDILVEMNNPGEWEMHGHASEFLSEETILQFIVEDVDDLTFNTEIINENYKVEPVSSIFRAERKENVSFTIKDRNDNPVRLSELSERPLAVTFINEESDVVLYTFPGNTELGPATRDDHDDGDNHTHSFIFTVAYADGGHDHSGGSVSQDGSYIVPVVFREAGTYRAFVEFVPDGEVVAQLATFDITVNESKISIDAFGWSKVKEWWILFIISILLMTPLCYFVFKYINNNKLPKKEENV